MSGNSRPEWLPAAGDEAIEYRGQPRIQAALPAVIVGLTFVVVGIAGPVVLGPLGRSIPVLVGALFPVVLGVTIPVWSVLRLRNTSYVVTESALYTKRGILGRSVTSVGFETIQNVTTSQSITGRLFDHGSIAVETAGGSGSTSDTEYETAASGPELAFKHVNDPHSIQRLIRTDQSAVDRSDDGIPGSAREWRAVCREVRAWRQAID